MPQTPFAMLYQYQVFIKSTNEYNNEYLSLSSFSSVITNKEMASLGAIWRMSSHPLCRCNAPTGCLVHAQQRSDIF